MFEHIVVYEYTPETQAHRIVLNQNTRLDFMSENPAYVELLTAISSCDSSFPIEIHYEDAIDFTYFSTLLQALNEQRIAGLLILKKRGSADHNTVQNELLRNYYLYNRRRQALDIAPNTSRIQTMACDKEQRIRRSKLALLRGQGLQMPTQHDYQHQHHREHAVQQEQQEQQQQEQQQEQQQFQTRQNQIQQQQQRMQAMLREQGTIPEDDLRNLIHADNLQLMVEETGRSLDELKIVWNHLVGFHANKVDSPQHRITHIPRKTLLLILKYPSEWRYGLELNDLPNGFGFAVHEVDVNGTLVPQSIFYYDKSLHKGYVERKDSPLSADCVDDNPFIIEGSVGQLYPFAIHVPFDEQNYQNFIRDYQRDFDNLFSVSGHNRRNKFEPRAFACSSESSKASFIRLMRLEQPTFDADLVANFSEHHLKGLCSILIADGADSVTLLLKNLHRLKQVQEYDLFKELFLDRSTDWRHLTRTKPARSDDLNAWQCFDYLCTMPLEQRRWWVAMVSQHAKANPESFDMPSLVNAQHYFFTKVTEIDQGLHLPLECPLENILNMKTAYARLLYLLKKAIDPAEQLRHLDGLDFGSQGVICAAYQSNYVFFSKQMNLTPDSIRFDWEKYRKYAPIDPKTHFTEKMWAGITPYKGNNPVFVDHPQANFARPPFRMIFASSLTRSDAPFVMQTLFRQDDGTVVYRTIEALENEQPFPPGTIPMRYERDSERVYDLELAGLTESCVCPGCYTDAFLDSVNTHFVGVSLRFVPRRIPTDSEIKPHRIYLYLQGNPPEIYFATHLKGSNKVFRGKIPTKDLDGDIDCAVIKIKPNLSNPYVFSAHASFMVEVPFLYSPNTHQSIIDYLSTGTVASELSSLPAGQSFRTKEQRVQSNVASYLAPYFESASNSRMTLLEKTPEILLYRIADRLISDPELQDDSIKTNFKTLAYGTDLATLVSLSKRLNHFSSIVPYFYRRVGQEPFTLPFKQYELLLTQLRHATLNQNKTNNDNLQKALLPLLAVTTTGSRVCDQNRNVSEDLVGLTHFLYQNESAGLHLVQNFNDEHISIIPRPTLYEVIAIWQLSTNIESVNSMMSFAKKYGSSVYQAFVYASQRNAEFTQTAHLLTFLRALNELPISLAASKQSTYILLASLTKTEHFERFSEIIGKISEVECSELAKLLETVSVADSTEFASIDAINALLAEIALISINESARDALVMGLVKKYLPGIKFKDTFVASSIVSLIRSLAPWVVAIDDVLDKLALVTVLPDRSEQSSEMMTNAIQDAVLLFLKKLGQELIELKNLIRQVTTEGNTDVLWAILLKIQNVIHVVENPLQDVTGVTGVMLRTALSPVISLIKQEIVAMLSEHTVGILQLSITNEVAQLTIRDSVLNNPQEHDVLLSARFSDFLVKQIPALSGIELAIEINTAYKKYEEIALLLDALKQMARQTTRTRRDELLAFLYRAGYFESNLDRISIVDLAVLIRFIAGKSNVHSVDCFAIIFDALAKGVSIANIQATLEMLTQQSEDVSNVQFQTLFKLGLYHRDTIPLRTLLELKHTLPTASGVFAALLSAVEAYPDQKEWRVLLPSLLDLSQKTPNASAKIADYLKVLTPVSLDGVQVLGEWLSWFENEQFNQHSDDIIAILHACVWSRPGENARLKEQKKLIEKLLHEPNILAKLAQLYAKRPNPSFNALQLAVDSPTFNIDTFINNYEQDPFGNRERVRSQWNTTGLDTFVAEIADLQTLIPLDATQQRILANDLAYIVGIGSRYALPIGNIVKPVAAFTRDELAAYLQTLRNAKPLGHTAQLQALAVVCEVMFRTTGKYPYYSQMASVLATATFPGNLLQEIPTGQGKSVTIALTAAMTHLFSESGVWTTVCSRNTFLTGRDYQESRDFYDYLNIETAWVKAGTKENHYETPKIIYTTPSDLSLYRSKITIVDGMLWPSPDKHVVLSDEVDAEFFDNSNAFNFSHSEEDPFINPLEWVYPLANDYIDSLEFLDTRVLENEDINLFRRFIKTAAPDNYRRHLLRLSDYKLNLLLEAACIAKPLQEKEHFLIRTKQRMVHGKMQTNSFAHLLIHHVEDTDATLCHGAQQCLHARLNKTYRDDIAQGTKYAFPCDNEVDCVDTQNSHSFFTWFGRLLGYTGTGGTRKEQHEAKQRFQLSTLLKIPPRKRGTLRTLATVFTDANASFFFNRSTQINAIKRAVRKAQQQSILIAAETIEKSEIVYAALNKEFPGRVEMIHAENADSQEIFEEKVRLAGSDGKITIITPLATRGTDFKIEPVLSQDNARTFLVIETCLDRYRNRQQLKGRTARDGQSGEALGVFDLSEIETTFNVSLRTLSHEEKLIKLTQIMEKMDYEACAEREIRLVAQQLTQDYGKIFDNWLHQSHDSAQQESILRAKAQWIQTSQQTWQTWLSESDPNGQYSNPYIRYNDSGVLDIEALRNLVSNFAITLQATTFPACKQLVSTDGLSEELPIAVPAFIEPLPSDANSVSACAVPLLMVNSSQAYLARHADKSLNEAHARYIADLEKQHRYETRLNYWLGQFNIPDTVSDRLRQDAVLDLEKLPNGRAHDLVLQVRQLQLLLEHTYKRLNTAWYRFTHPFADQKIAAIKEYLASCPGMIEQLSQTDSSANFDEFKKQCHTILAMNTTWGGVARTGKSRSIEDFKQLELLSFQVFSDSKTGVTASYLEQIVRIKKGLQERCDKAGFFKNKTLYEQKIQELERLIEALQQTAGMPESNLFDVQQRMEKNEILSSNTNRFFSLPGKVTTAQEIMVLQQVLRT